MSFYSYRDVPCYSLVLFVSEHTCTCMRMIQLYAMEMPDTYMYRGFSIEMLLSFRGHSIWSTASSAIEIHDLVTRWYSLVDSHEYHFGHMIDHFEFQKLITQQSHVDSVANN